MSETLWQGGLYEILKRIARGQDPLVGAIEYRGKTYGVIRDGDRIGFTPQESGLSEKYGGSSFSGTFGIEQQPQESADETEELPTKRKK